MKDPKLYCLFYDYFYRPCVGDKEWSSDLRDPKQPRIGNPNTEAFAHLMLENCYWAWIIESFIDGRTNKVIKDMKPLKTEYDTKIDNKKNPSLVDLLFEDFEIAPPGHENNARDEMEAGVNQQEMFKLVFSNVGTESEDEFKRIMDKRKERVNENLAELENDCRAKCMKRFLREVKEITPLKIDREELERKNSTRESREYVKAVKRAKNTLLQSYRIYTGTHTKTGVKKVKTGHWDIVAWSRMSKMTEEIRKDQASNWYSAFERTYRKLEEMKVEKRNDGTKEKKKF